MNAWNVLTNDMEPILNFKTTQNNVRT